MYLKMDTGDRKQYHSKWYKFISLITQQEGLFDLTMLKYRHEITSAELLYAADGMKNIYGGWLNTLKQIDVINEHASNTYREAGNTILKSSADIFENAYSATEKYTNAIRTAPTNSLSMAQAHANRAASILKLKNSKCFNLKQYLGAAYDDCVIAKHLKYKHPLRLLWRQAQCAFELNNCSLLKEHVSELDDERNKGNVKSSVDIAKLVEYKKKIAVLEDDIGSEVNKKLGTFRSKIIEKYTLNKGRHFIAQEFIPNNTEIVVEQAYAFLPVSYENENISCHACAAKYIIPFQCSECRFVFYCSIKCIDTHRMIHQYECKGYQMHLFEEIGISHLSLRCFLTGIRSAINRISAKKSDVLSVWNQIVEDGDTNSDDYSRVLRLNTNYTKIEDVNCLKYGLTAAMQTVYLKQFTMFFEDLPSKCGDIMPQDKWELVVAALIMRHLGQVICNGHAITGTRPVSCFHAGLRIAPGELHTSIKFDRIFTALYPVISTLNHSCNPNIRNIFDDRKLTIMSTRDIMPLEEILNCYGPHYKLVNREEREVILRDQYYFYCDCSKCKQGNDHEHQKYNTYICSNEKCKQLVTINECDRFWWRRKINLLSLKCTKCEELQNFEWVKPLFNFSDSGVKTTGLLPVPQFDEMMKIYEHVCKQTTEHNLLRLNSAECIIQRTIFLLSTENTIKLQKLAMDVYIGFVEYLGIYNEKSLYGLMLLLDIFVLAEIKQIDFKKKPAFLDFNAILNSFPKKDQMIIIQYINTYLNF